MDEIDSIGSSRIESGSGGGDNEVQRTMLELLNQLDGFEATKNIKVIMATNRIDILDSALLRPGRIDRKIEFPPPNEEARLDILKIHSRKMNLTRGINLRKIAEQMGGSSGAEVKGTCTEAGMYALREKSSRHSRRLRDGCGQDYAEGHREEHEHQEALQVDLENNRVYFKGGNLVGKKPKSFENIFA